MNIVKQLTIIFSVGFAGSILSLFSPIPFPGGIMSMLLLLVLLLLKVVKVDQVKEVSQFFIANIGILLIVPSISILDQVKLHEPMALFHFVWICVAAALITFLTTAAAVKITLMITARGKK